VPGTSDQSHPEARAAVAATADLLESCGHVVEEAAPEALDDEDLMVHFANALTSWVARDLDHLAELTGHPVTEADVEPGTWAIAEAGRSVSATTYLTAVEGMHAYTRRMARWWESGFDLLLTPTIPVPPPELGSFAAQPDFPMAGLFKASEIVPFTAPFNTTGQPAISLPLHVTDDGLPIGVQLVAAYGREDLLVRVAAQLEAAAPWADRRPPIHA
jgi:amidase